MFGPGQEEAAARSEVRSPPPFRRKAAGVGEVGGGGDEVVKYVGPWFVPVAGAIGEGDLVDAVRERHGTGPEVAPLVRLPTNAKGVRLYRVIEAVVEGVVPVLELLTDGAGEGKAGEPRQGPGSALKSLLEGPGGVASLRRFGGGTDVMSESFLGEQVPETLALEVGDGYRLAASMLGCSGEGGEGDWEPRLAAALRLVGDRMAWLKKVVVG